MGRQRRCAFIASRPCLVDVDELPLDVCRRCIDAWKIGAEVQALTAPQSAPKAITAQRSAETIQTIAHPLSPMTQEPEPLTFELPKPGADEMNSEHLRRLQELDSMFINDRIDADEYVAQRRAIVSQLSSTKKVESPVNLDDDQEIVYDEFFEHMPLVIIERKRLGYEVTSYPEGVVPRGLDRKKAQSIYSLYDSLKGKEGVLIQFNGTRLGLLGKKKNRLLCALLQEEEGIHDRREEIDHIVRLFNEADSEDLIKTLTSTEITQTFSHKLP